MKNIDGVFANIGCYLTIIIFIICATILKLNGLTFW